MSESKELAACPFCGGGAVWNPKEISVGNYDDEHGFVDCTLCGMRTEGRVAKYVAIAAWNRRSLIAEVRTGREAEPVGKTYYDEGRDADWFAALDDKEFAKRASYAAMDIVDGDFSNVENYMPVAAILSEASIRIEALLASPAPALERKDGTLVPPAMSRVEARQSGFTGDVCSNCGSARMQIAGHCQVCAECGTTTGCS